VVALGSAAHVTGFAVAGVTVIDTDDGGPAAAWDRLPADTGLVILTSDAARVLADRLAERPRLLWTVVPAR
jgi:vacuolar-type H+-ATPase subunit F/Vma7